MAGKKFKLDEVVREEKHEPKLKGQQNSKPAIDKVERIKVTFYLDREDNLNLEEVKLNLKNRELKEINRNLFVKPSDC